MSLIYQTTRLSFNPALYYRTDMVGPAANGDVIPDLSGNSLHGTLGLAVGTAGGPGVSPGDGIVAFQLPYGHPSPIETDDASREFCGHNFNGGPDTETSRIYRASDPLIEPSGDFTADAWIRPSRSDMGLAFNGTTGQQLVFKVNSCGIYVDTFTHLAGFCFDSAGGFWKVVCPESFVVGQSYYVAVVRFGNALALYVNAQLRALTTITSGLPTRDTGEEFRVHPQQITPADCRYDEVAFQLNALSGADILTIYEAALLELTMRGESNIRTTAVINGTDEPDPAAYPIRHNWDRPVVERFRWRTSVFKPVDGSTGLRRQRSAPRRQVEYTHLLYSERLRQQFEARSFAGRTAIVQFEPDKVRLSSLNEGATTATFDTRYRDFESGHRVLFYEDDDTYEYATLVDVTSDSIEWGEPLSRGYTNVWVKPARVARLPLEQELELQSDIYADTSTIYEYLSEDEPLSPRRIVPYASTLTYHDREVFDLAAWQGHDYSELPTVTFTGDRSELDDGTGVVTSKQYRWGSDMVQPYNMNLEGRETIARYLGWLYARAGQYAPFWMPTFRNDLARVSRDGSELTVRGHEYTDYYAAADTRLDLAFVYFDNTTVMRRIVSATVDGADDVLTLDAAVPTFAALRWLSFLRRVVLSSDDLEIAWETDDVVRVAFAVTDAPLDAEFGSPSISPSPSASISTSTSPSGSSSRSLSPSASGSPSASISPTISPSSSTSHSASQSLSPSPSASPSI